MIEIIQFPWNQGPSLWHLISMLIKVVVGGTAVKTPPDCTSNWSQLVSEAVSMPRLVSSNVWALKTVLQIPCLKNKNTCLPWKDYWTCWGQPWAAQRVSWRACSDCRQGTQGLGVVWEKATVNRLQMLSLAPKYSVIIFHWNSSINSLRWSLNQRWSNLFKDSWTKL